MRKIDDIANPFCDGWFRAGGSKEKIQGTYFEICQTYFKIGQTYFLPFENPFAKRLKDADKIKTTRRPMLESNGLRA